VRATLAACLLLLVSGCAVTEQAKPTQVTYSGFLGNYSDLTATDNKDQALLRYVDPTARWSSYTAVFIEPVTFWAGSDTKLPPDVQLTLTQYAYEKFKAALEAKGVRVVDQDGPGVIVLHMALTDATSATPVLRTIAVVIPQARLISAVTKLATGQYAFTGSVQSEGEALDGTTGQRVAAWVDKRFGGTSVKNADVWKWGDAEKAIDFWANTAAQRYVDLQQGRAV
jgi:Protein of unknown function (DUF3313)